MTTEKRDLLKIILLGVIALTLLYQTLQKLTGDETPANVPNQQPVAFPGFPGQQPMNPQQALGPKTTMSIDLADVKLETLSPGEKASHTFVITNTGDNPMKIFDVTADPGFALQGFTAEEIPPEGIGEVKVQYQGNQAPGTYTGTIHVNSNTVEGHIHMTVTAEVQ